MQDGVKRALLLVDRGSREPEVRSELEEMCSLAKAKGEYDFASYCFLEVLPPFIEDGINQCLAAGAEQISVMPYFLYPGMKLKDTVKKTASMLYQRKLKIVIARPLSYHSQMAHLVMERVNALKSEKEISTPNSECDLLLIGHGSSDRNAHDAFMHVAESARPFYRKVHPCFLELDTPDIAAGLESALVGSPKVILMMPYFLHKGAHIKRDVKDEIEKTLGKHNYRNAYLSKHLGVDEKLVELVLERAREVEKKAGF